MTKKPPKINPCPFCGEQPIVTKINMECVGLGIVTLVSMAVCGGTLFLAYLFVINTEFWVTLSYLIVFYLFAALIGYVVRWLIAQGEQS